MLMTSWNNLVVTTRFPREHDETRKSTCQECYQATLPVKPIWVGCDHPESDSEGYGMDMAYVQLGKPTSIPTRWADVSDGI